MTIGDIIKAYRAEHDTSMDDFARRAGLSKAYISILERNINPSTGKPAAPSLETIKSVASAIDVDVNALLDMLDGDQRVTLLSKSDTIPPGFEPMPEMVRVPRVGYIACGQPILAEQNIEDYDSVPASWRADFTLVCEGDSMLPHINNGDLVAIRRQPSVENGEIAAVRIDDEATLKYVYRSADKLVLQPANAAFEPLVLIGEDMNSVCIEGKAVGFCRAL